MTFLFTDIEGSTRLWEEHAQGMEVALSVHDDVMRSTFAERDGYVFATGGDGFAVAFVDPGLAVQAAVDAQRRLSEVGWPDDVELRVRMGINSGPAQERDGDYFGPAVNRTARLMSAAHGGQVVVSAATHAMTEEQFQWIDLGDHRLRDLATSEHVFQLAANGIDHSFAPLRTVETLPGNLPRQLTSFVGRSEQLSELLGLVRSAPLVTLTGVGGVGKSRLAIEVAAACQADFRDGAWFVELAPVTDGSQVPSAICATLGIHAAQGHEALDSLVDALRLRRLLITLDNCEHLSAAAASVVDRVLSEAPNVMVLATSREGLGVRGEHLWLVPSLPAHDEVDGAAIDLFVDRARSVRADFELDERGSAEVIELCARLDGIPLAIELAAARIRSLTPAEILARIDQRFQLLTGRDRRALERHQTLRGTVDWSYDLLNDAESAALRRLAVFGGGCDLQAAETVLAGGPVDEIDVIDLLDSLVDKSLLIAVASDDGTRFRMLETIRQYAEEKLAETDDGADTRRRHAQYYRNLTQQLCEAMCGPSEPEAHRALTTELPNVRAAVEWATATGETDVAMSTVASFVRPFIALGTAEAGLADIAQRCPGASEHRLAPEVMAVACWNRYLLADLKGLTEQCSSVADVSSLAPTLQRIILMTEATLLGDYLGMTEHLTRIADVARRDNDVFELAGATANVAFGHNMVGQFAEAEQPATQAVELAEQVQCPSIQGMAWFNLALSKSQSDPGQAAEAYRRAIHYGSQAGAGLITGNSHTMLGSLLARNGDLKGAAKAAAISIRHYEEAGDLINLAFALHNASITLAHAANPLALELSTVSLLLGAEWQIEEQTRREVCELLGEPLSNASSFSGGPDRVVELAHMALRELEQLRASSV